MLVLIVIVAVVIVAVMIFLAVGRGGGMSAERNDYVPLDLGPVSATDVALLRPPTGLWGYNMQATDEAIGRIAEAIRDRDVRIVALEQLVTDLSRNHAPMTPLGSAYAGARHRRGPTATVPTYETAAATGFSHAAADETAWQPGVPGVGMPAVGTPGVGAPGVGDTAPVPFEPPGLGGEAAVAPPEQSHD